MQAVSHACNLARENKSECVYVLVFDLKDRKGDNKTRLETLIWWEPCRSSCELLFALAGWSFSRLWPLASLRCLLNCELAQAP